MTHFPCHPAPRRWLFTGAIVLLTILVGCSSDGSNPDGSAGSAPTIAAPSGVNSAGAEVVLDVVDGGDVTGLVVTDRRGFAVYGNTGETVQSLICLDDCTVVWIPLTTEGRTAVSDRLDQALFGLIERPDGITQVSYAGVPLYLWSGDSTIGITGGAGIAGTWFALTETGGFVE